MKYPKDHPKYFESGKAEFALSSDFQEWITAGEIVIVSLSRNLRSTTNFYLSGGIHEKF